MLVRESVDGYMYPVWQDFSIGTVAAYSDTYSALVAYKILELFQY